jgi:hypothetical protein
MVVTRTGVSLHLAGTVVMAQPRAQCDDRPDGPSRRRSTSGYVDALRLADPRPSRTRADWQAGAWLRVRTRSGYLRR